MELGQTHRAHKEAQHMIDRATIHYWDPSSRVKGQVNQLSDVAAASDCGAAAVKRETRRDYERLCPWRDSVSGRARKNGPDLMQRELFFPHQLCFPKAYWISGSQAAVSDANSALRLCHLKLIIGVLDTILRLDRTMNRKHQTSPTVSFQPDRRVEMPFR